MMRIILGLTLKMKYYDEFSQEDENKNYIYTPKKRREPLQERNNYISRQKEKKHFNEGDYSYQDRRYLQEERLSKYNGLRLYNDSNSSQNEENFHENYSRRKEPNFRSRREDFFDDLEFETTNNKDIKNSKINESKQRNKSYRRNYNETEGNMESKNSKVKQSLERIRQDISNLKIDEDSNAKEIFKPDALHTLNQIQCELDALKENQKQMLRVKEKSLKIIEREVLKVKENARKEKQIEIDLLREKYESEIKRKDDLINHYKNRYKENVDKYREMCVKKIKTERVENDKNIEFIREGYEKKIEKYRIVYGKLKEKYKNDVLKKYTDL